MTIERIDRLEKRVDEQAENLARIDERQARMHEDLVANTHSVRELTVAINKVNSFIDNRKGAAWMLGIVVSVIATLSYAGAWVWDHFLK